MANIQQGVDGKTILGRCGGERSLTQTGSSKKKKNRHRCVKTGTGGNIKEVKSETSLNLEKVKKNIGKVNNEYSLIFRMGGQSIQIIQRGSNFNQILPFARSTA